VTRTGAAFTCLLLTAGWTLEAGQAATAPELAERIQGRYAAIRDFTADFTLTTTSSLSLGGGTDRGKVAVKKPLRMRWTLATGSEHEVVADGRTLYTYLPKDKIVRVVDLTGETSSSLLLLTGRGDLTKDFTSRMPADQPATEWRLTLLPKTAQPDYTEMTLSVDRASLRLLGLDVLDEQGTTRKFRFSNLRENPGLSDAMFQFRIPAGVEVQR
jgi:outer membrane lipoprotein carrier protein